ncbi:hypothetical protein GOV06_01195 [Candidatus Woesearchaeota archaeon]|nr:hypothetical protein [Candidatus Woesearchaeota archaeon]
MKSVQEIAVTREDKNSLEDNISSRKIIVESNDIYGNEFKFYTCNDHYNEDQRKCAVGYIKENEISFEEIASIFSRDIFMKKEGNYRAQKNDFLYYDGVLYTQDVDGKEIRISKFSEKEIARLQNYFDIEVDNSEMIQQKKVDVYHGDFDPLGLMAKFDFHYKAQLRKAFDGIYFIASINGSVFERGKWIIGKKNKARRAFNYLTFNVKECNKHLVRLQKKHQKTEVNFDEFLQEEDISLEEILAA